MYKARMYLTHLIFSGGNIKGFVFLGVLRYLYAFNHMEHVRNVAGTSFGAVVAALVALKIPIEDFEKLFIDYSNDTELKITQAANIHNIFTKLGMESARKYTRRLSQYIEDKYDIKDITFQEVSKKFGVNLYVNSFCVNTQQDVVFSVDTTPDSSVMDVLTAAISLPIISQPVCIEGMHYCDSFIVTNVLSEYFERVPDINKLVVMCNVPIDCKTIERDAQIDPLTYYSIIGITCLNSIFEYSSIRHINDKTLVFTQDYPLLHNKITEKGIVQDFDQAKLESAILYGFNRTSEYFNGLAETPAP